MTADAKLEKRHRLTPDAGVSKALIYAYFPTQHDLFNAVLASDFETMATRGIEAASRRASLADAALETALAYHDHVAENGPLAHIVLRDAYMAGRVSRPVAAFRDAIVRRLARLARRELSVEANENIAAINLITTIPEQCGRLVWQGDMTPERGRQLCAELIASSLSALRPRAG
jgi:AcrR family transcriptional regulator